MLAHGHQAHASVIAAPTKWSPTRDHTELSRGASERIAHNAFTRAITRVRVRQHSFPRLHACFPAKLLVHPVSSGREIRRTLAGLFHRRTPSTFRKRWAARSASRSGVRNGTRVR